MLITKEFSLKKVCHDAINSSKFFIINIYCFKSLGNLQSLKFLFCTKLNRNCWEATHFNTLQFNFPTFTLFNLISIILGTLNYILCNSTPLLVLSPTDYTQNKLRSNERLRWNNNSVWIWKTIADETREVWQSIENIPINNYFKIRRATCCAI